MVNHNAFAVLRAQMVRFGRVGVVQALFPALRL